MGALRGTSPGGTQVWGRVRRLTNYSRGSTITHAYTEGGKEDLKIFFPKYIIVKLRHQIFLLIHHNFFF